MTNFLKSNLFFLILLTAVLFCLYGKTLNFGFTYGDDTSLILEKAELLSDIRNAPVLFTTSCYYSKNFTYYRPLLNLSFMAETLVFGINTHIYHATNIILFILSLYLMYLFSAKILKARLNDTTNTVLKCLFLLTAVHPLFTSAVAWIPARNDTLLAVFMYASFIFFVAWLENKKTKNLILYFLFFVSALFTKESSILTVFLYALLVWCFNYKITKREITTNILIFVPITVIYLYLRHLAVAGGNLFSYVTNFGEVCKNMIAGSAIYLYQFIVPDIHVMLYDVKFGIIHFVILSCIFLFVCFGIYKNFINKKIFFWCISLFVLLVFPTCFLDDYIILNHRLVTVIPAIIIPLALMVENIHALKRAKFFTVFVFVFFFINFSGISFSFTDNFRDKNIYWYQSYVDAPNCHATCYWMGRLFFENGDFDKARKFLIKANDLKMIYLSDLALIYYFEGDLNKAEELYKQSVIMNINKAQCYRNLSTIYYRSKDFDKALKYAEMAINEEPLEAEYVKYYQALLNEQNKNI